MVFDISVALTWILFIALFPITFYWLRRAWQIIIKRDFSEVALKRGVSPARPEKFALYAAIINLLAGGVALGVILGVISAQFEYQTWSSVAGVTIWLKVIADFILSRHAHPLSFKGDTPKT